MPQAGLSHATVTTQSRDRAEDEHTDAAHCFGCYVGGVEGDAVVLNITFQTTPYRKCQFAYGLSRPSCNLEFVQAEVQQNQSSLTGEGLARRLHDRPMIAEDIRPIRLSFVKHFL